MKKILLVTALAFLLSSCSKENISLIDIEIPSRLPFSESSEQAVGLLNPDAEVRGVWIASVGNINFPSKKGLSPKQLQAELDDIVESCTLLGLNTIFFQVRPAADALYSSELFPASEYVSGTQGRSAPGGFDCLKYLIKIAHNNKINVHAWVNPLRVTYGSAKYPRTDISQLSGDHIARKNPHWVIPYADGKLYFDAGNPDVRDYVAAGVGEIVSGYDVDGVVFDDYFYPYPVVGEVFDDSASYAAYGTGDIENWRRENINSLVKSCYETVKSIREECLFGISPFGIWQNDDGKNGGSKTAGLEAYKSLYCDALAFAKGGYVDYLSPQLYWRFDTKVAPYGELAHWWNAALDGTSVKLIISHAAYMYEEWREPGGELKEQIEYARELLSYRGSVFYGYDAIKKNVADIREEISEVFENEIIYSDAYANNKTLKLLGLSDKMDTTLSNLKISGESDPTLALSLNGQPISREKNGDFQLTLNFEIGENILRFKNGGEEVVYRVYRK